MTTTPLLVGITGHRDITDESGQAAANKAIQLFQSLKEKYPSTPVYLLSGMADGADRVIAKAALDANLNVQAVLPMPLEMYKADFSRESLQELEHFLGNPQVDTLELPVPEGIEAKAAEIPGEERNQLYAQLGDYLTQHCSILIALWDGVSAQKQGGTSEVLLQYLGCSGNSGLSFHQDLPNQPEATEYVYWYPVARKTETDQSVDIESMKAGVYLTGELSGNMLQYYAEMPAALDAKLKYLDDYNAQYDQVVKDGKFFTWGGLIDSCPGAKKSRNFPLLQSIDAEFQKADGLALYNQQFSDRQFKLFAYMAAFMGLLFLFYAKILASKVFLIAYLGLFLAGFWMFKQTEKNQWFSKHLMQRVIAETLRTRFYLVLAGVNDKIDINRILSLTGVNQFSGFSWIHQIFRLYETRWKSSGTKEEDKRDLEIVTESWLNDQAGYFHNKVNKLSHSHHKIEKIKNQLLIASALCVVLLIFFKKLLVGTELLGLIDLKTLLVFFMGLLPFWLGVWEIYQSNLAVKELLWQYKNQANIFSLASFKMEKAETIEERKQIIIDLGEKSLMENYLWTIHRYHREHEPPTAG